MDLCLCITFAQQAGRAQQSPPYNRLVSEHLRDQKVLALGDKGPAEPRPNIKLLSYKRHRLRLFICWRSLQPCLADSPRCLRSNVETITPPTHDLRQAIWWRRRGSNPRPSLLITTLQRILMPPTTRTAQNNPSLSLASI